MNQSIDQLSQKLDANIKEARMPTDAQKAIEIATRHREEIRQKMQSNTLTDEEKRLYENADNELAKIIADAQKGRAAIHTKTEAAQGNLQQTVTNTEKPAPTVDDATMRSEMAEYQTEARNAIRNLLVKNGQIDENSIKQAVKLADDLAHLRLDETQFAELEETERDILKQQMPAVQGMIGAIFVESLFANGYDIRFNGSGTVDIGKKMGEREVKLAPTQDMQMILNSYIGQNPSFLSMLKAGLLFHAGDINQYLNKISDTNGNPQNEKDTTFASFSSYLRNRPSQADTSAGKAIMNSQGMFSDSEFRSYLEAAKYVPALANGIQAISNNPNLVNAVAAAGASMVNVPQNGNNSANNSANNLSVPSFSGGSAEIPTFAQSLREKGTIGGVLEQIGASYGHMFNAIGSSPAAATGALIAFIASGFFFGWKNTFKTALVWIPASIFGWNALKTGWDSWNGNLPKASPDTTPLPAPNAAVVAAIREEAHAEKADENAKITDKFLTATVADVNAYLTDKKWNLTDEQKTILDNLEQAEIVKKEYETALNKLKEKTLDPALAGNPEVQQLLNESVQGYTLEYLYQLISLTPEQIRDKLAGELKEKSEDPSLPQEVRDTYKELLDQVQSGALKTTDMLLLLTVSGLGLYATFKIIQAIGVVRRLLKLVDLAKKWINKVTGFFSPSPSSSVSRGGTNSPSANPSAAPNNKYVAPHQTRAIDTNALNKLQNPDVTSRVNFRAQVSDAEFEFKANEGYTAYNDRMQTLKNQLNQRNALIDQLLQTELKKVPRAERKAVEQAYRDLQANNNRAIGIIDNKLASVIDPSAIRPFQDEAARKNPAQQLADQQQAVRNAPTARQQRVEQNKYDTMADALAKNHDIAYKVNGTEVKMTYNDALEFDRKIKELLAFDGRTVTEVEIEKIKQIISEMEDILVRGQDAAGNRISQSAVDIYDRSMFTKNADVKLGGFIKRRVDGGYTTDFAAFTRKLLQR